MLKRTGGVLWMSLVGHFYSIEGGGMVLYNTGDILVGFATVRSSGSYGVL